MQDKPETSWMLAKNKVLNVSFAVAEDGWRLSAHVPQFQNRSQGSPISLVAVADWMSENIFDELEPAGKHCQCKLMIE